MKKTIDAVDIVRFIEEGVGDSSYKEWDGGFITGTPEDSVKSVAVTWMILTPVLKEIASKDFDMIICHEGPWIGPTDDYAGSWANHGVSKIPVADMARKRLLEENGITLFMCHYGLDKFTIYDEFARSVGCSEKLAGEGYTTVHKMNPVSVKELIIRLKGRFGLDCIRYTGDEDRVVKHPGLLFGGTGLNNNSKMKLPFMLHNGADVIIAGEMDEFTVYNCVEAGIPIIECGHAASEMPGLSKFAEMLKCQFPDLRVECFETPRYIETG